MSCHEFEEGAVYACEKCGLEIKIIKACQECCGEHADTECTCLIECCGTPLIKKE